MPRAYIAFELPDETRELLAATNAITAAPQPVAPLATDTALAAAQHAAAAQDMDQIAKLPEALPQAPQAADPAAPVKRGPGRPRKTAAAPAPVAPPAPVAIAPAEPAPVMGPPPPPAAEPAPDANGSMTPEAEAGLRADVAFEAARVARLISVPGMRSLLQRATDETVLRVEDIPPGLLAAALTELRAVS